MKYQFTGQVSYDLPVGKGRAINSERHFERGLGRLDGKCNRLSQHRRSYRLADFGSKPVISLISVPTMTAIRQLPRTRSLLV